MARFCAIVCDHCDTRNIIDEPCPAARSVRPVRVRIEVDGDPDIFKIRSDIDLCMECIQNLHSDVIRAITQIPKEA